MRRCEKSRRFFFACPAFRMIGTPFLRPFAASFTRPGSQNRCTGCRLRGALCEKSVSEGLLPERNGIESGEELCAPTPHSRALRPKNAVRVSAKRSGGGHRPPRRMRVKQARSEAGAGTARILLRKCYGWIFDLAKTSSGSACKVVENGVKYQRKGAKWLIWGRRERSPWRRRRFRARLTIRWMARAA